MPKLLDQTLARHDLPRVQQQQRQHSALLAAPQPKLAAPLDDLHRTQDAELHARIETSCNKPATAGREASDASDERRFM
jgi:hypothetical protein